MGFVHDPGLATVQHLVKAETIASTATLAGAWHPVSEFWYHAIAVYQLSTVGIADIDYYVDVFVGTESSAPPTAATAEYARIPIATGVTTESTWLLYQPDASTYAILAAGAVTWIRGFVEGGATNAADTIVSMRLLSH
jgi:hypothetical protein